MSSRKLEYFEEVISLSPLGGKNNASGLDLNIAGIDKETVRTRIRQVYSESGNPDIEDVISDYVNDTFEKDGSSKPTKKTLLHLKKFKEISIANLICELAKKYSPVDTGFMRDNIEVIVQENIIAVVSFAEYSIYVHEAIDNYHAVGRAKFLEDAAIDVYNRFKGSFDFEIQYEPLLLVVIHGKDGVGKQASRVIKDAINEVRALLDEFGW